MDLYTSLGTPMTQNVYGMLQTNVNPLPVMTGSSLPMTFYHKFLSGKPLAAGITIIVLASIQIALGIWSIFQAFTFGYRGLVSAIIGVLFWAPIFYIITGSLMITGKRKPSICLVSSSMILNIISSVMSVAGFSLAALDIYLVTEHCHYGFRHDLGCTGGMETPAIILVSDVLLLLIFIYSAVSAGRSMKHVPSIPQAYQA